MFSVPVGAATFFFLIWFLKGEEGEGEKEEEEGEEEPEGETRSGRSWHLSSPSPPSRDRSIESPSEGDAHYWRGREGGPSLSGVEFAPPPSLPCLRPFPNSRLGWAFNDEDSVNPKLRWTGLKKKREREIDIISKHVHNQGRGIVNYMCVMRGCLWPLYLSLPQKGEQIWEIAVCMWYNDIFLSTCDKRFPISAHPFEEETGTGAKDSHAWRTHNWQFLLPRNSRPSA